MTKRKRLLGTTFYAIMLVSNLFLQEEKGNKGAGNSSIPAVSASHPKSSKHPFKLNGRLDNFQEKTKRQSGHIRIQKIGRNMKV